MPITPPHPNRLDYWIDGSPAGKDHCKEWWRMHKEYCNDTQNFTCIKCLDVYWDSRCPYKFRTKRVMCEKCINDSGIRAIKKYNNNIIRIEEYAVCKKEKKMD
jgi:hypothetical protein